MSDSWQVATILDEPLADTLRFAAWYLDQGAAQVTLYFDRPEDAAIGVLADHPRISCIPCTPQFWQDRGLRADTRFTKRQNAALTHAYAQAGAGWLLAVDADEFVTADPRGIGAFLGAQPDSVQAVRFPSAEALRAIAPRDTQPFRLCMDRDAMRRAYGDKAGLLGPRRRGLVGHPQGKSATRTGLGDLRLRQHWAETPDGKVVDENVLGPGDGAFLLHFFDRGYDSWRSKVEWRARANGFAPSLRNRILAALDGPAPEAALQGFYRDLHEADDGLLARLDAEGALLSLSLDLDAVAQAQFGEIWRSHGATA